MKASTLLFIISTYTDGQPPESAAWFYNWLEESVNDFRVPRTLLSGVKYSVFGLGNSLYKENYNKVSLSMLNEVSYCDRIIVRLPVCTDRDIWQQVPKKFVVTVKVIVALTVW